MADAQATFVATLDSSGIQTGARSGLTALERMGMAIQKRSKDLAALKSAQDRLGKSAGVQEYLKRQKAIEKAEESQAKAARKVLDAEKNVDIARQANVSPEDMQKLTAQLEQARAGADEVAAALEKLGTAQDELTGKDASVAAYRDQAKVIKETEAELADLQAQYSAAGGSASDLADKIEEPKQGIDGLLEQAKEAGVPLGKLGDLIGKLGSKAGPAALLAAIVAIGVAAVVAVAKLARFVAVSADMARNAARARSSAAFGSMAGTKEIDGAMAALRENTAASKEQTQALAIELYRLGDRGDRLTETALTIERFGQLGEDAQSAVKGLYEELRKPIAAVGIAGGVARSMVVTKDMLPRDVFLELANQLGKDGNQALVQGFTADKDQIRQALARIGEQRFAGPALEQMRSLDKLGERLRENLQSLFEKLRVGVLFGALQKLVAILDEGSASGQEIRKVLGAFAQPFANAVEAALPYLTAFVKGLIFGGLLVALVAIKIKNALSGLIPSSLTKNIDWLKVSFYAAGGVVVALAISFGLLAAALLILTLPFWTFVGLIALVIVGLVMLADAVVGWWDSVSESFEGQDFSSIAKNIIDGLIGGLKDGAAALYAQFTNLAKGGYQAFKDAIMSRSPSRLFRMAGRTIPQGTALGVEDETDKVESAVASMASPTDMVAAARGGSSNAGQAGGNRTYYVTIQVVQSDDLLDESFARRFMRVLDGAAREGGVEPEPEGAPA